jgi:DNA uptake protein ComE-like DNA-binding protein
MMMVVSVMAVALHLLPKLKGGVAQCQIFFLPKVDRQTENGPVRKGMRFRTAVALGCALWAGAAQARSSAAHYGDRDTTRAHKTSDKAPAPEARIDINHATLEELVKVPGMTETWARRIVRFRPYWTKDDLLDKGIVTSQVYDRIKDYVIAHRDAQ